MIDFMIDHASKFSAMIRQFSDVQMNLFIAVTQLPKICGHISKMASCNKLVNEKYYLY